MLVNARVGLVRGVGRILSSSNKRHHFGAGRRVCQLELNRILINALWAKVFDTSFEWAQAGWIGPRACKGKVIFRTTFAPSLGHSLKAHVFDSALVGELWLRFN